MNLQNQNCNIDEIVLSHKNNLLESQKKIEAGMRTTLDMAIFMGHELTEVKKILPYGDYSGWIEAEMPFSVRSAQTYLRLFTHRKTLEAQLPALLDEAIDSIKTPKTAPTPEPESPKQPSPITTPLQQVKATRKPAKLVDKGGAEVPEQLLEVFQRADEIKAYLNQATNLKNEVTRLAADEPDLWRYLNLNAFQAECGNVIRTLKFAIPYAVCRFCFAHETQKDTCQACKGAGWLNEKVFRQVPEEMK